MQRKLNDRGIINLRISGKVKFARVGKSNNNSKKKKKARVKHLILKSEYLRIITCSLSDGKGLWKN